MQVVLMIIAMTALLLVGDYLIKYATESKHPILLSSIASLLWLSSVPGWYWISSGHRIAITGAVFSVASIVGTTLIGIIGFKEKLCGTEIFGLVLAIAAMILLARKI